MIPTLFSSPLSISTQGKCRAIATVRDGVVTRIVYAGPARGLSGSNADCAPIVRARKKEEKREVLLIVSCYNSKIVYRKKDFCVTF